MVGDIARRRASSEWLEPASKWKPPDPMSGGFFVSVSGDTKARPTWGGPSFVRQARSCCGYDRVMIF